MAGSRLLDCIEFVDVFDGDGRDDVCMASVDGHGCQGRFERRNILNSFRASREAETRDVPAPPGLVSGLTLLSLSLC